MLVANLTGGTVDKGLSMSSEDSKVALGFSGPEEALVATDNCVEWSQGLRTFAQDAWLMTRFTVGCAIGNFPPEGYCWKLEASL